MPDLAVLVPSRGRPANVARLIEACARTCRADTVLQFGFDDDDPALTDNLRAAAGCWSIVHDRMHLAPWTNYLAAQWPEARYLCSMGDDMVPITDGWDEKLIAAAGPGGMAYPQDRRRDDIPECVVIDTAIVRALGWMCPPRFTHWYIDNVWADIGNGAGCLTFCPDVIIEHRHPNVPGGDKPDRTYHDAAQHFNPDLAVYQRWRLGGLAAAVSAVRGVRAAAGDPVGHAGPPA